MVKVVNTSKSLAQHQLVILRRLRLGPLTEFELTREIAEHSGHTAEEAADRMAAWLTELRSDGLIWSGELSNSNGQHILAAALTKEGRELVN